MKPDRPLKAVAMRDWPCNLCGKWHPLFYVKMIDGHKALATYCTEKGQQTFLPYIDNLDIETRPSKMLQKVMASSVPKPKKQLELL